MRSDSQLEILDPVIRAVAVAVMHFFPAGERTPEGFLHLKTVLGDAHVAPLPGNPCPPFDVPRRVYTYGHRNPQGITFRPGNDVPYAIEHGPNINDEVNRLAAGGNRGWDPSPVTTRASR
jgi:hypothetical protein